MLLDIDSSKSDYFCKVLLKKQNWRKKLKVMIYKKNLEIMKTPLLSSQKYQALVSQIRILEWSMAAAFSNHAKKTPTDQIDKQPLKKYPHGFYAFYMFIKESRQLQDELSWKFPYFKQLDEMGYSDLKNSTCYVQISALLVKLQEQVNEDKLDREGKNKLFQIQWQRCVNKYQLTLDLFSRLDIYVATLKKGTQVLKEYYHKFNLNCDFHVFYILIMKCSHYLRYQGPNIHSGIKSFSMQHGEELNQVSISQTFKMLFCSICNLYDCGKHDDDPMNFSKNHQYVSPINNPNSHEHYYHALQLINSQHVIYHGNTDTQDQKALFQGKCSPRCYKHMKTQADLKKKSKEKSLTNLSPFIKSLIHLGIRCFSFDPCFIWIILKNNTQTIKQSVELGCDTIFMYLIEDYSISNKLKTKLCQEQSQYLKIQYEINPFDPVFLNKKKITQIPYRPFNKKLSVCHHFYLGSNPCDQGCLACICSRRGYCLPQCLCHPFCRLKKGCDCKSNAQCQSSKCFCYQNGRQCQVGLCLNCFGCEDEQKSNKCKNKSIIENRNCLLRIGKSQIEGAGLGLFAGQNIKCKQMVYTYQGQTIQHNLQAIRQSCNQTLDFYTFANNNGETVDARIFGNKSRFINHTNQSLVNLVSEIKLCKGSHIISFYAKKDIKEGSELYFNYDGNGQLALMHKNKYPFITNNDYSYDSV